MFTEIVKNPKLWFQAKFDHYFQQPVSKQLQPVKATTAVYADTETDTYAPTQEQITIKVGHSKSFHYKQWPVKVQTATNEARITIAPAPRLQSHTLTVQYDWPKQFAVKCLYNVIRIQRQK